MRFITTLKTASNTKLIIGKFLRLHWQSQLTEIVHNDKTIYMTQREVNQRHMLRQSFAVESRGSPSAFNKNKILYITDISE